MAVWFVWATATSPANSTNLDVDFGIARDNNWTWAGNAGGTANVITLTVGNGPALAAYADGQTFGFKATASNSGATTIAVNALGALPAQKDANVAMVGGEIISGRYYTALVTSGGTAIVVSTARSSLVNLATDVTGAFAPGTLKFAGAGAGVGTFAYPNSATNGTITIPAVTDTVAVLGTAETFTAKQTLSGGADVTPEATPTTVAVGYLGMPTVVVNAARTFGQSDNGKALLHDEVTARTWNIDSNANLPMPIGAIIALDNTGNAGAAGAITLTITTDTLRRGDGVAGTGTRTIPASAVAFIRKSAATTWVITGTFT